MSAMISKQSVFTVNSMGWRFENTYARLPEYFFVRVQPAAVQAPAVVVVNHALAKTLGLNTRSLSDRDAAALFSGQIIPSGAEPLAQAYAGHQFGSFTMLGDGRAILLGEHRTPDGHLVDVQFKGSGQTPFSRRGDGLAALGPMLREYIISEAMYALGIPTTRSLAVVLTGEPVYRDRVLRGAVLTRVAASHVRVGTFEYLAAQQSVDGIRTLVAYVIDRLYPELKEQRNQPLALLEAVAGRQAELVAAWQCVGFIHGVMNTDNMALSGETIDYGPCAFMDGYHPDTVFSSIDHMGRYAYGHQPRIAQWNLARFAETLLPVLAPVREDAIAVAQEVIQEFPARFEQAWLAKMRRKLGLATAQPEDRTLIDALLVWMEHKGADFTNTFRGLSIGAAAGEGDAAFAQWLRQWSGRLQAEGTSLNAAQDRMRSANPAVIPRNHNVEEALAAAENGNPGPMMALLEAVGRPFEDGPHHEGFREPAPESAGPYQTFCGT